MVAVVAGLALAGGIVVVGSRIMLTPRVAAPVAGTGPPGDGGVETGEDIRVPAEVPVYPGAQVRSRFQVDGNGEGGAKGYEYEFTTADAAAKVVEYYSRKFETAGMKLALSKATAEGGMLVAEDDPNRRTLRVIVGKDGNTTTINVTARVKRE
jgi:hypothetical protein